MGRPEYCPSLVLALCFVRLCALAAEAILVKTRNEAAGEITLVSVAGMNPQVFTETVYCLTCLDHPAPHISEVHLLTTRPGKELAVRLLLAPGTGQWQRFCSEHGLTRARDRLTTDRIHVVRDAAGRPLEDIRSRADHLALADFLMRFLRDLTARVPHPIHCSVAGGRKTMGILLALVFQLFARPGDRLSHVLVWPPELEGDPNFFYPPRRGPVRLSSGKTIPRASIRVELAEVPFLRLEGMLSRPLDRHLEQRSYSDLIQAAQEDLDRVMAPAPLQIVMPRRRLEIGSEAIDLTPLEMAMVAWLARRRVHSACRRDCPGCEQCFVPSSDICADSTVQHLRGLLEQYRIWDARARELAGWKGAADRAERFYQVRGKVNAKLAKVLGHGPGARQYLLDARALPPRGDTHYGISLRKDLITVR